MPLTTERVASASATYPPAERRNGLPGLLVCGAVFLLPLVCWPGPDRPFSAPKLLLLLCVDLVLAIVWLCGGRGSARQPRAHWWALGWAAAVSISAISGATASLDVLLLTLAPLPIFFAIGGGLVPSTKLARAIWLASACEALLALLQYYALDPLRWLGWQPEQFPSARMRIYGTLGNPDFVAAWLCAALPFCWREIAQSAPRTRSRALRWAAATITLAAIMATGSRVFALILPLQAGLLALRSKRMRFVSLLALPMAATVLYLAPARQFAAVLEGRLYFARIAAGTPLVLAGSGPGSFEAGFAASQSAWLKAHPRHPSARFAGTVDHAHNDYLEFLVEYGPVGLAVFLGFAVCGAIEAWRGRNLRIGTVDATASAGAATLLAIAAVDFPFHRPAEWTLFWVFAGILAQRGTTHKENERCQSQSDE